MSTLIDTHCHLTHARLAGAVEGVLARAGAAGVRWIVVPASDVADSAAAAGLAERCQGVYFTAGVHPHQAKDAQADYLRRLEDLSARSGNAGIGEIGLDYHYDFSPRDAQRRIFAEQLALAGRLEKPAVIHTREALDDTLAVLAESRLPGARAVFHSFTGGADDVRRVLTTGAMVSYSGIATFAKAQDVRRGAALVPDDRLLLETDAPYLSPEPVRSMPVNEPANVVHVAACLAAVRGVAVERLAELTTSNAIRFFGISL